MNSSSSSILRAPLALAALCSLAGCLWSPASRTHKESGESLSLSGWATAPSTTVTLKARNNQSQADEILGVATSGTSETFAGSGLYPWSVTLAPLARRFWIPDNLGVAPRALGRAEITAMQGEYNMLTFTGPAQQCVIDRYNAGDTWAQAGSTCSDGSSLVLFDNTSYNQGAQPNAFTTIETRIVGSPAVKASVVSYASDTSTVYGIVCEPLSGTDHWLAVYNHGGMGGLTVDEARGCVAWAQQGWVLAASTYRGEVLNVPPEWGMPQPTYTSTGVVEISLGEVKDAMRLVDIARTLPSVDESRTLIYGVSHGGAITLRAVEQGAPVKAAIAVMPATDWTQLFNDCIGSSNVGCDFLVNDANLSASWLANIIGGVPAANPRSYDWRSPYSFRGDLTARKDVKIAIMHGMSDGLVNVTQSCKLASAAWGSDFKAWRVPLSGPEQSTVAVPGCPVTLQAGNRPALGSSWPDQHYLMLYENTDHAWSTRMWSDFVNLVWHLGW